MPGENTLVWFGDRPKVHAQLRLVISFIARYNYHIGNAPVQQGENKTKGDEIYAQL